MDANRDGAERRPARIWSTLSAERDEMRELMRAREILSVCGRALDTSPARVVLLSARAPACKFPEHALARFLPAIARPFLPLRHARTPSKFSCLIMPLYSSNRYMENSPLALALFMAVAARSVSLIASFQAVQLLRVPRRAGLLRRDWRRGGVCAREDRVAADERGECCGPHRELWVDGAFRVVSATMKQLFN
jgi:hypothetical protein